MLTALWDYLDAAGFAGHKPNTDNSDQMKSVDHYSQ